MVRFLLALTLAAFVANLGRADDPDAKKWEKKYEQLLEKRPDIRRKVESGGATKEQVIAWMKKGGEQQKRKGGKKYYGAKIEVKDPAEFRKSQEKVIYSGPQPGEKLPAFTAIGLRGKTKGQEVAPIELANNKPLLLIFQDNSVVGQKGLLLCGQVLATIAKKAPRGLHVSTTFLVDDPSLNKVFAYDFMKQIDEVVQMSVSRDRREGPGAYGLNRNVAMTIIVAKDGKVLHNFALKQPMLYPDPYVLGAIADAVGVERTTLASWFKDANRPKQYDKKQYKKKAYGKKESNKEKSDKEKSAEKKQ